MSSEYDIKIGEIGDILNLSMSSASNAVSLVIEKDVKISTINSTSNSLENTDLSSFEPAVFAEFDFSKGAQGKSNLVFKKQDIKKLVEIVLQREFDEEFHLDEINISAVNEVLLPLVETCFSSLLNFANIEVKATQPKLYEVASTKDILNNMYKVEEEVVVVRFKLFAEGTIDSEMALLLNKAQVNGLLSNFDPSDSDQDEIEENVPSEQEQQQKEEYVAQGSSPYNVKPPVLTRFEDENTMISNEDKSTNLNMIMNVPLEISVEIGNTKKKIKDILDLTTGSIVELNKQAGAPVDVHVNGKLIANGEVVVVDENYGVKISEILDTGDIMKII